MSWWQVVVSSVLGGVIGGGLGGWLNMRWRDRALNIILANMDRWGGELRASSRQVQDALHDDSHPDLVDPTVLAILDQMDVTGHDDCP